MKFCPRWKVFLVLVSVQAGCVTQTEKIAYHRYYDPPENESVLDELRREFGWQKPPPWVREEPFYKRAAQEVKKTVTGWFQQSEPAPTQPSGFQSIQEFQQAQKEAVGRLQQQKSQEIHPDVSSSESTNGLVTPGPDVFVPEE